MKNLFESLLLLFLLVAITAPQQLHRLELYSQERGASCLDGSPPGLYIHQGNIKDKFMIYFDSGGFCAGTSLNQTLEACYQRSSTGLGTTTKASAFKNFSGHGVLSPKQEENPVFYDWTKIFVIYCDGSQYLGNRDSPIQYKDKNLYFRGAKNVMETFYYLSEKYDFYNKDTILITGVSAGGMATFEWSNYLMENTKSSKVLSMPDSGFFITDYFSPIIGAKILRIYAENLLKLVYDPDYVPEHIQKCMDHNPSFDIVDCVNAGNYAQYLKAPTFIIQSPYDQYSLDVILVVQCLTNAKAPYTLQNCNATTMQAIEDYRQATLNYLNIFKRNIQNVGAWSPACVQHGFSDVPSLNNKDFEVEGVTLTQAIRMFVQNPESPPWLVDQVKWPQNKGCNGMFRSLRYD